MPSSLALLQKDLNLGLNCVKTLWRHETKGWITSVYAADIDQDGDVEVLASARTGRVYALSKDGDLLWSSKVVTKAWVSSIAGLSLPPDQSPARMITSGRDGQLYALDKNGAVLRNTVFAPAEEKRSQPLNAAETSWRVSQQAIIQLQSHPATPYEVTFASEDRCVYRYDLTRSEVIWRFASDSPVKAIFLCDIDGDGRVETLVGTDDHALLVLSADGEVLARHQMEQAVYTLCAADLDHDGKIEILVGTRSKKLFVLTSDFCVRWSQKLSSRPLTLAVADVDKDGQVEILASCDDYSFFVLDHDGNIIWRQNMRTRFYSLAVLDLDRDNHVEVLAGADDNAIYALRIQLVPNLDKKIRRVYRALNLPEAEIRRDLTTEQRWQLSNVLGVDARILDKTLSLSVAEQALAEGDASGALLACLQLARQRFRFLWEKENIGYLNPLCFVDLAGDGRRATVVSAPDGGLTAFTSTGRSLWSKTSTEEFISDVQAGYLTGGRGEDLAFLVSSGRLFLLTNERRREVSEFPFHERITCFALQAANRQGPAQLLLGTEHNTVYLYTNDLQHPVQTFHLADSVQAVYASAPLDEGLYRTPEILISTSANQLLAYTRGGNCLWQFETRERVKAFCTYDLDGDGRLEVLVGDEDCNFHVLDYQGNRRWRYVLAHSVQAIEVADIDEDGNLEILVGCGDGVLAVFTASGDLIWRYQAKDRIQAVRVCDIDQDGNQEIALLSENCLEVLRAVNQAGLSQLTSDCWAALLQDRDPLTTLLPLCRHLDPFVRGTALCKLATLCPQDSMTLDLLEEATYDKFTTVRRMLPEAVMLAYTADPARARRLLNILFTDEMRDVRIEVVECLELLARADWNAVLIYLRNALESFDRDTLFDRNARRAALRKVSHLLGELKHLDSDVEYAQREALFQLLLTAAQYVDSVWVTQEAGRVLADWLNQYPTEILVHLHRLLDSQLQYAVLRYTAYNLTPPEIQQAFTCLLDLCLGFPETEVTAALANAVQVLDAVRHIRWGSDLWLLCRELHELFALTTFEDLAAYEFRLKREQLQSDHLAALAFLRIGERFTTITRTLKTYLRRDGPNDQLNSLFDGIKSIETLQLLVEQEYGASPIPGSPQPRVLEYVALKTLLASWKERLHLQRLELRGHAELACELQSHEAHLEETIGVWLSITNRGRGSATNVKVTLLSSEHFEVLRSSFETDAIFARQETVAEFFIKPLTTLSSITLTFEVFYDDVERDSLSFTVEDHLDLLTWKHTFLPIENPYSTGIPLRESQMCYGRDETLAYLQDQLTRTTTPTILVLYGQRRSGKTTLLNQLTYTPLLAQHIPVLIDLQRLSYKLDVSKLFFRIAHSISQAMQKKGLQPPFPDQELYKSDAMFAFDCFLDEIEPLLQDRKLILLLDEFEVLEEQVKPGALEPEIFQYLRSIMQSRYYIHFLLAGLHNIESLTRDYWSVFFQMALHYRLPNRMMPASAEDLITKPVAGCPEAGIGNLVYDPLALTKIHQLAADQPYLIHLLCRVLVDHCNERRKNYATVNDVNLVLNEVLRSGTSHFGWLWDKIEEPARQRLLQVIAEETKDEGRQLSLDDIRNLYRRYHFPYNHAEVLVALKALLAEEVVEASESIHQERSFDDAFYRVPIGLLRQWLKREKPLVAMQSELERSRPGGGIASSVPIGRAGTHPAGV